MNAKVFWGLLCATLCLTGCLSVDSSVSQTTGEEHLLVDNYGWRLFNCIPLVCGNATHGEKRLGSVAFFRNDVTTEKVQAYFMAEAAARSKRPEELTFHRDDSLILLLPLLGISIPIPYILTYEEIQLSGVLK